MAHQEQITLSILVPTIGRTAELDMLLDSIQKAMLHFPYEIIIIDQNPAGFLDEVLSKYQHLLPISHHLVAFKGLSKAKNYGVKSANGTYVCFPDDDCKVFPDTFPKAFQLLEKEGCNMVFGKCIDEKGNDSVLNFQKEKYTLNKENMLGGFVEATVVCKKEIFDNFKFDENMGAGTFFGAEEGFDWLYRILTESSTKAVFSPEITFYHPQVILSKGDLSALNRVFKYRCGTAYLCHKHHFAGKYYKRLIMAYAASKLYYFTDKEKSKYYKTEFLALQLGKIFAEKY